MKIQRKTFLSPALAVLGFVFSAASLWAVLPFDFEWVYGHDDYFEQALKGAVPVQICPAGGYISVGFTRRTGLRTDSDVYVVRIAENGAALWERTFDIGQRLGNDVGTSVRELRHSVGNGFVIAGTTSPANVVDRDIFLLELDCDGRLLWLQGLKTRADLQGTPTDDVANDVMETDTGALVPPNQPRQGDLIVAGSSRRPLGSGAFDTDAYLVRTDFQGSVIWSRTYSNWGGNVADPHDREWFNALSEAQPINGQAVGDVLAAGAQADTGWQDGLAVRVSGGNGLLNLPLHTMASFNVPVTVGPQERLAELWAIRELQQAGQEHLNIVLVGNIAEAGKPTEGYAAKTGPNLNTLLAERVIGDGFAGLGNEGFADFQEIVAPTNYGSAGNLVVAGYATINGNQDVAMLALNAGPLTPVPGTGRLFGDHAAGEERGTALSQVLADPGISRRPGFYINGFTRSDPARVGDPEDMYLIKANASGQTDCSVFWVPGDFAQEHGFCPCELHGEDTAAVSKLWPSLQDMPSWGTWICH
jgi:hypothetical protein